MDAWREIHIESIKSERKNNRPIKIHPFYSWVFNQILFEIYIELLKIKKYDQFMSVSAEFTPIKVSAHDGC